MNIAPSYIKITSTSENLNISHVIIGGDFNTDLTRSSSLHSVELADFMWHEHFVWWLDGSLSSVDFTYESKINGSRSTLDHFLVTANLKPLLLLKGVLHCADNLSDHSAIYINLDVPAEYFTSHPTPTADKPQWNKANNTDICNYKCCLDTMLSKIDIHWDTLYCRNLKCSNTSHLAEWQ